MIYIRCVFTLSPSTAATVFGIHTSQRSRDREIIKLLLNIIASSFTRQNKKKKNKKIKRDLFLGCDYNNIVIYTLVVATLL